jgi:ribosomal protein L19
MDLVKFVEEQSVEIKKVPAFKAGDTVSVHYKIREGNKERIQVYQGVVIQRNSVGVSEHLPYVKYQTVLVLSVFSLSTLQTLIKLM